MLNTVAGFFFYQFERKDVLASPNEQQFYENIFGALFVRFLLPLYGHFLPENCGV